MKTILRVWAAVAVVGLLAAVAFVSIPRPQARANTVVNDSAFQPVVASATGAASASNASIPAVSGRIGYLEGFDITGCAPSAAGTITITVTGLQAGTQSYAVSVQAGVANPAFSTNAGVYCVRMPEALPASAPNTAIVVNVGSFGTGSTAQACTVYGGVEIAKGGPFSSRPLGRSTTSGSAFFMRQRPSFAAREAIFTARIVRPAPPR